MSKDGEKTFEETSVTHNLLEETEKNLILFVPGKFKIQPGRDHADDINLLNLLEIKEFSSFKDPVSRKYTICKLFLMFLVVVAVSSLIVLPLFYTTRISDEKNTRNRNNVAIGTMDSSHQNIIQETGFVSTKSLIAPRYTWRALKNYIIHKPFNRFQVYYAGHKINCNGRLVLRHFQLKWNCRCFDTSTRIQVKCKNYQDYKGACKHSLAQLVRIMNKAKIYPLPADAADMGNECKN